MLEVQLLDTWEPVGSLETQSDTEGPHVYKVSGIDNCMGTGAGGQGREAADGDGACCWGGEDV